MMHKEWLSWIEANKPVGMPDAEFRNFLGLIGTLTVQQNLDSQEITMDELIHKFFVGEVH